MNRFLPWLMALAFVGCATQAPSPPAAGTTFTGEVWIIDEQTNTVTLRQPGQTVRVKVSRDQLTGLRPYQNVTLRGELAPPPEMSQISPPGTLVARGAADELEVTGTVASVDSTGTAAITSQRGPVQVWVATPNSALRSGDAVRVRMLVQPLELQPAAGGAPATSQPQPPAATEPGDYAVVRGPVRAIDQAGRLTVDSPRGPIQVWVPQAGRYKAGDWVEVVTAVRPTR